MSEESVSILTVDDDPVVRQALTDVLEVSAYDCATADSARAALEVMSTREFELVICDINMPGEDGVWLLGELRERYPDTAVLMLTGVDDVKTAVRCLKKGASDFLRKPFRLDEVMASVSNALERRRLLLENRAYQRSLELMVRQRTQELHQTLDELEISYNGTLEALITALDAREKETRDHSRRVQLYTVCTARHYGMNDEQLKQIGRGALLHDIGKIGVSDTILLKPGKLTAEEWVEMRRHPEIGYQILKGIPYLTEPCRVVRYHHEQWNGSGYPSGLREEEIPIEARIFAVADTFDAMTSDRVYRPALHYQSAVKELLDFSERQFDPRVVECFLDNLEAIVGAVSPAILEAPDATPA